MAGKWCIFFHPVFTLLSRSKRHLKQYLSVTHWLNPIGYTLLSCLTAIAVLLASPSFAKLSNPLVTEVLVAQNSSEPTIEAQHLDQTAKEQYANGQFREAATAFQQAAQRYQAQGNRLGQAISLSNLSLAYQQINAWTEASQAISASLQLLETEMQQNNSPDRQSAYAQALDIRAKLELSQGRAEQAVATWERAASIHQQLGQTEQATESQINQARALQHLGLYKRSITVLETALQTPEQLTLLLTGLSTDAAATQNNPSDNTLTRRLQALPASKTTVAALQSLGEALQVVGNLEQAKTILQYSLKLAEDLDLPDTIASSQLNLANLIRAQAIAKLRLDNMTVKQAVAQLEKQLSPIQQELQYPQTQSAQKFDAETQKALDYYQQAADRSSSGIIPVQAQLNRLNLLLDKQQWLAAATAVAQIDPLLKTLPPNRATIDAHINFAQSLIRLESKELDPLTPLPASPQLLQAAQLLATARQQAIELGDAQAESYALGSLGNLYERTQQWSEAARLTQQALDKSNGASATNLPQTVNDVDLSYRWQYQLGRILTAQNDREKALKAYEAAAKMLKDRLRLDIASSNLNYQFSFDEEAQQPVYRDWMALLLQPDQPSQNDLQQVREVSSSLLEAQLTSFLQEPCAVVTPQQVDTIVKDTAQKTAIFYPVILPDRLEVVVKLPETETLYHYRHRIPRDQFLQQLNQFQIALEEEYTFEAVENLAKQFYDWLVKPAEAQLAANYVDTLVFTLDRQLQTIPFAALHDGTQYLVKKYAVSQILGLRFSSDRSLQPEELKIMAAGLSFIPDKPPDLQKLFLPLKNVGRELTTIEALRNAGIGVVTLKDQDFTLTNFNARLNEAKFPVVHLATHGQFSVNPQRTFLLTAQGSSGNSRIDVDELAALFRVRGQIRLDSIDLLILNACETAAGDNLATLGLAGTAVRAGAQSAIASLWTLGDAPSVDFTKYLYENLRQPNVSRAEALRQTQLALMQNSQYRHPRYWSPYILAGNWLPLISSRADGSADSK